MNNVTRTGRVVVAIVTSIVTFLMLAPPVAAAPNLVAQANPAVERQLVDAINSDRLAAGLPPLLVDPQLTDIARQRDQYMLDQGIAGSFDRWFSHCFGGGDACPPSQYQFGMLLAQRGFPEAEAAENLAVTTDPAEQLASSTNSQWMASAHHRPNIENPHFNATGIGVVCCFTIQGDGQVISGVNNGQPMTQDIPNVALVAQIFEDYAPAKLQVLQTGRAAPASAVPAANCQFELGFKALHDLIPTVVGDCTDQETHNAQNGDAVQHTVGGLLVWRKADNWTAFTNGSSTWVNGPQGLMRRLNTQRYAWESNPDGLPVLS